MKEWFDFILLRYVSILNRNGAV